MVAVILIPLIGYIIYLVHRFVPTRNCGMEECIGDQQGFAVVWGTTAMGTALIVLLIGLLKKIG